MPAVSALWEVEVETEAQKFKIITIENSEGYKRPCLKNTTKLLSNRSDLVPLLGLPGVIRATTQQEPALGLVREVIPWFQCSWHGSLHWTTPHGFLAALLGLPSSLSRVTWHDSAVCLSPADIPLMFVSNPKSSAAANTTPLSPIGRGKCTEKQISFPVTGLWLREAPGWGREQLESSRELPHSQPPPAFPEAFCRPSCREVQGVRLPAWGRDALCIFFWDPEPVGMSSHRPDDLKMRPHLALKRGRSSGGLSLQTSWCNNSAVLENQDSAWCFEAHLSGPLVYLTFQINFLLTEGMPLATLLVLRGLAESLFTG